MSVRKIVTSTLTPTGVPVRFMFYDGKPEDTYITFFSYSETASLNSDDEEAMTGTYIQVDLWTKSPEDYGRLETEIKERMKAVGFTRRSQFDQYEQETGIYHKVARFYISIKN